VIFALGEGALKAILAKPSPAVPTIFLGAVGTAASAIAGRSDIRIELRAIAANRILLLALIPQIIFSCRSFR
jgi:hypothetical protein